jgi:hypothetical protein
MTNSDSNDYLDYEMFDNENDSCQLSKSVKKEESLNKRCMYCNNIHDDWDMYKVSCGHYYHTRCFRKEMNKQYTYKFKYHCLECKQNLEAMCVGCDIPIKMDSQDQFCKPCLKKMYDFITC